jgi:SAM-dependent methyltransferase
MSLRYYEIAEANHRIQNPLTDDKLMLLGAICRLQPGMRHLDLACGKGEMLCRWAQAFGTQGVGVDISAIFLDAAQARARELEVESRVHFVNQDARTYAADEAGYDIVSCLGATCIGNGMLGTIARMRPAINDTGLLIVGEPYWTEEPPSEAYDALGVRRDEYCVLSNLLDRCKAAEVEMVEMVLATQDSWDRYRAPHWMAVSDFLRANPGHPDAADLRAWINQQREVYLKYGRRYMGWGAFVLRPLNGWR